MFFALRAPQAMNHRKPATVLFPVNFSALRFVDLKS